MIKRLTTTIPPKRGPLPQGLKIKPNKSKTISLEKINGRHRQIITKR
jgi:hypothetical protein